VLWKTNTSAGGKLLLTFALRPLSPNLHPNPAMFSKVSCSMLIPGSPPHPLYLLSRLPNSIPHPYTTKNGLAQNKFLRKRKW
jgi:hypothetical protein